MVFEGLGFEVSSGEYLSVKGRNGAGKSTLLRMLAGFIPSIEGTISLVNATGSDQPERDLQVTDFLLSGHQNGLKPAFTLRQNMDFLHQSMTGHQLDDDLLFEAASHFGLAALIGEKVQYFSSGQRHRSALMRFALIARPIWLMDEPTVGLDAENRSALAGLIKKHLSDGGIVLAASHDPIDVEGTILNLDEFAPKNGATGDWL